MVVVHVVEAKHFCILRVTSVIGHSPTLARMVFVNAACMDVYVVVPPVQRGSFEYRWIDNTVGSCKDKLAVNKCPSAEEALTKKVLSWYSLSRGVY